MFRSVVFTVSVCTHASNHWLHITLTILTRTDAWYLQRSISESVYWTVNCQLLSFSGQVSRLLCSAPNRWGIKRWCCLTYDVSLSHTSGLTREQRPRKTNIGTEVATSHVTRTPLSRSKGQGHSGSCSSERGNVLSVGTYCYVAVCRRGRLGGARCFGAYRGRRGAGAYCGGRPPTACLLCFEDLQDDPYDPVEADPMKCRAIESSLWELKVSFVQSFLS